MEVCEKVDFKSSGLAQTVADFYNISYESYTGFYCERYRRLKRIEFTVAHEDYQKTVKVPWKEVYRAVSKVVGFKVSLIRSDPKRDAWVVESGWVKHRDYTSVKRFSRGVMAVSTLVSPAVPIYLFVF